MKTIIIILIVLVMCSGAQAITIAEKIKEFVTLSPDLQDLSIKRYNENQSAIDVDYKIALLLKSSNYNENAFLTGMLELKSKGVLNYRDSTNISTDNALTLDAQLRYVMFDVVYRLRFKGGCLFETQKFYNENLSFNHTSGNASIYCPIPGTDLIADQFKFDLKYPRGNGPAVINASYLGRSKSDNGGNQGKRIISDLEYEIAFHPIFIFHYKLDYHHIFEPSPNTSKDNILNTYTLGMDFRYLLVNSVVLREMFPGAQKEGKNFIYYEIAQGKKPPYYVSETTHAVGFKVYF